MHAELRDIAILIAQHAKITALGNSHGCDLGCNQVAGLLDVDLGDRVVGAAPEVWLTGAIVAAHQVLPVAFSEFAEAQAFAGAEVGVALGASDFSFG